MTIEYDFEEQLKKGKEKELFLDNYFSQWYSISGVSRLHEKAGIDRIFHDNGGRVFTVEYKSDNITHKTGNFFVETLSVKEENKLGWAYTSQSQLILYFVPEWKTVYVIDTVRLKKLLLSWIKIYPEKNVSNKGYTTVGIPVPKSEFKKCVNEIVRII